MCEQSNIQQAINYYKLFLYFSLLFGQGTLHEDMYNQATAYRDAGKSLQEAVEDTVKQYYRHDFFLTIYCLINCLSNKL
jgi:hypothetical protein